MEIYLYGVAAALLLGIVNVGRVTAELLSTKAKNFKRMGLYYRYSSADFTRKEPSGPLGFAGMVLWMTIISPLGSWLSVVSFLWRYGRDRWGLASVSEREKDLFMRLRERLLTKEELIEFQEEFARIRGLEGPAWTAGDDDPNCLVLENEGGWYAEVTADPSKRTLTYYSHTDDHLSDFKSTEEYRFEGDQVLTRLIEDFVEHPGETIWHVKDGVVLESQIRHRHETSKVNLWSVEEELAKYAAKVAWQPIRNLRLRYFVMAQHPTAFPFPERRRMIRGDLERLEAAARKARTEASALGLELHETEEGTRFTFPESFTEEDKDRVTSVFQERLAEIGVADGELKTLRADLLKLLGEPVEASRR